MNMQMSVITSGLRLIRPAYALLTLFLFLVFSSLLLLSFDSKAGLFDSVKHPLPVDQAFAVSLQQNNDRIDIVWDTADDYYLYQDKLVFTTSNNQPLTNVALPPAKAKQDPIFGDTKVYFRQLRISGLLPQTQTPATSLTVTYQGCWDGGVCYPPQTTVFDLQPVTIAATGLGLSQAGQTNSDWANASGTNANWFVQQLTNSSRMSLVFVFLLAGLALAFTPCVLPMVPILSSIIVGLNPKPGPGKSFALSATYVLSMALTYSLAGVAAGLSGANVQIALQHPAVIGFIAVLFVLFAAAMFGWVTVQMPKALQQRLNQITQSTRGGQYSSVAIMGSLSALIVGPCVAAPLAGALIFISQSGDPVLGGLSLFAMGIGMGLPLLLVGTSAGHLIPKAGPWMQRVKVAFGFLMLYMALWMTDRVWPELTLPLVALVTLFLAFTLLLNQRWKPTPKGVVGVVVSYGAGLVLGLYALLLLLGQFSGQASLLNPWQGFSSSEVSSRATKPLELTKVVAARVPALLAQAKREQMPVMLDFYADWCISCKELDAFVFSDADVQATLDDFNVIKVDVTANEDAAVALMRSLGLVGPPALVFYTASGDVLLQDTIIGVPKSSDLIALLAQVKRL